ncbi:hypothetical protein MPSEU_000861600 [Mayamaea pseudoterrestris]|nr:hypothetical protein MPSEU_000861600 [Mayamaea pseudoterrestris]
MSRWDALKPDNTKERRNNSRSKQYNQRNNGVERHRVKSSDEASSTLVDDCFNLRKQCLAPSRDDKTVISLSKALNNVFDQIPVSQVANLFVEEAILNELSSPDASQEVHLGLLQTIQKLLLSPSHASAIMSPIVEDVSAKGKEQLQVNPIRIQLFQALQQRLLSENNDSFLVKNSASETLTMALKFAYKIEQTRKHAGASNLDVEPSNLQIYLTKWLPKLETKLIALQLLRAFLTRHPYAAPSLAMSLLASTCHATNACCRYCGYARNSILLDCFHDDQATDRNASAACAMECTVLLLRNIPLDLWMSTSSSSYRSTLNFHSRVASVLENVISVTKCRLHLHGDITDSTKTLTICILAVIPFQHASSVLNLAVELVEVLTRWIDGSNARQTFAFDGLVSAAGGSITPQGELVPMSQALRTWLDTHKGKKLLVQLLSGLKRPDAPAKHFRLVGVFLRSHPALVTSELANASAFTDCVQHILFNANAKSASLVLCMEMLQGLLRGRHDYPGELNDCFDVVPFEPCVFKMICNADDSVIQAACDTYSYFLPSDWERLHKNGHAKHCIEIFQRIVDVCECRRGHKGKSNAWKCLGDMCTNFFPIQAEFDLDARKTALDIVAPSICRAASGAEIEPMVLFALGNLVTALKDSSLSNVIDASMLHEFGRIIMNGLIDHDDKVVSNSIRAIGRIDAAVAMSTADRSSLTWKQRSATNKLAWGAANALKVMFSASFQVDSAIIDPVIFDALVSCVEQSSLLNDKVACCATSALRNVNFAVVSPNLTKKDLVARCLAACIASLFTNYSEKLNHKLHEELELLLEQLIYNGSSSDLSIAFVSQSCDSSHLKTIYEWMQLKGMPEQCFRKVLSAIRQSELVFDVEIEQQFARHASIDFSRELDEEI